jgi:hypothetical protein
VCDERGVGLCEMREPMVSGEVIGVMGISAAVMGLGMTVLS